MARETRRIPDGLKTDYLWSEILTREELTDIIENYAQIVDEKDDNTAERKSCRSSRAIISSTWCGSSSPMHVQTGQATVPDPAFGRQRQEQLDRLACAPAGWPGAGQDSMFDSVIVVTDRRVLDKQIQDTIKQFAQVTATVGMQSTRATSANSSQAARRSSSRRCRNSPFILDEIGNEHRGTAFRHPH